MIAMVAKALRSAGRTEAHAEELKIVAIFCGAGLLLSLVAAMGFDLNLGLDLF